MSTGPINAQTTPLNKLHFGADYPGGSINARKTMSEDGIPELLGSIIAHGLIYPLLYKVAPNGKRYVGEGNRRLKALRLGVSQGKIAKDWATRSEELPPDADALDLSLTANIMRLPMHEVDQYEAFVQLRGGGKSVAEIASSYGTSELVVTRRLALGGLSPKLRQAWREEKIDADDAKAFTVVQDHALQDQVYTSLAQGQMLQRSSILRALTLSDGAAAVELRFVGCDAYLAAGGRLYEDLFVDEAHVLDPEILKKAMRDKIDAACRDLVAEGWGWAAYAMDLPKDRYRWETVKVDVIFTEQELVWSEELKPLLDSEPKDQQGFRAREAARLEQHAIGQAAKLRSVTAHQKAGAGCALIMMNDGSLRIERGLIRPGSDLGGPLPAGGRPAAPADGEAETVAEPEAGAPTLEISGVLAQTVSEWSTIAAANALADEPDLALRVLLAALRSVAAPARLQHNGWPGLREGMKDKPEPRRGSFAEALADTLRIGMPHLKAAIAAEVARSLDLTAAAAAHPAQAVKGGLPLVDALAEGYLAAARQAFDPAVFFDRAPAAVAVAAVAEMGGPKPRGKKGHIALAAADLARDLGWLPPGMRSSGYVPPRVPAPAAKEGDARGRCGAPAGAPLSA